MMNDKFLYFECNTGISGDMVVASMLDLGADRKPLDQMLQSLKDMQIGEFEIQVSHVEKSGIGACDFNVILSEDNHDHDMQYLYGYRQEQEGYDMPDRNLPDQPHTEHHHHHHRPFSEIRKIISEAELTEEARDLSLRIFTILAKAEGAVHGKNPEEVQFHEVGALDSIVDILSAAVCYDTLRKTYGFQETIIPKVVDGTGNVRCQHGIIPVPVPAVVKIAELEGLPLAIADREGEYVTPTGAAFAAAVKSREDLPERFHILKTGIGAGKRKYRIPGLVRTMLIEG